MSKWAAMQCPISWHYSDVIIIAMASQITGVSIVYSTVRSVADKKTHKVSRQWPLWGAFTGDRLYSRHCRFVCLSVCLFVNNITEKRLNVISWNFQQRTHMKSTIWNIFGMLWSSPWILGRFFFFLDPCLLVILWKNGCTDFHDFLMKCQARHNK